jgi:GNAT superfamily N-acetyltransferase
MNPLIRKILRKIGKLFYRNVSDDLAVLRRQDWKEREPFLPKGLRIEKLNAGGVEELRPALGRKTTDDFLERLEASDGYAIFEDNALCGWIWGSASLRPREGVPPLVYPIQPPPRGYYLYDLFVFPEHRKMRTVTAPIRHLVEEAWKAGMELIILSHHDKNAVIRKTTERMGFVIIGNLSYRRILCFVTKDFSDLVKLCELK